MSVLHLNRLIDWTVNGGQGFRHSSAATMSLSSNHRQRYALRREVMPLIRRATMAIFTLPCAIVASASDGEISPTFWVTTGNHEPPVCMAFKPGGALQFKGGFVFLNPSKWDGDSSLVNIYLGGKAKFPTESLREQKLRRPDSLYSFDPQSRRVTWKFPGPEDSLEFAGNMFFRAKSCAGA